MRRGRSEFSDAFAKVLQRHREAKKLSRQALSQKAGLHQTYIGMIEREFEQPQFGHLKRHCGSIQKLPFPS